MNCEQAEELLGAYALDALPSEEMGAVRAHLATCPDHAAKAAELRAVALTLGETADDMTPPPHLRNRISAAVAASTTGEMVVETHGEPVQLSPRTEARMPARTFAGFAAPVWGAIAAVLALAVGGLLMWNIAVHTGDSASSTSVQSVSLLQQDTGATAGFVVVFDDESAAVVGEAMPRLDTAQAYQLWSLDDLGQATSLGLMDYDEMGVANASVSFDGSQTMQIAVTIEPAGGSDQPTTPPLYVADL